MDVGIERNNKNVVNGFFGALAGSLIGAIPWVIVGVYLNLIVGWLGVLIVFCAVKGYDLFGGRECKTKYVIVIAFSVLAILAATFLTSVFQLKQELEDYLETDISIGETIDISIGETIEFMFDVFEAEPEIRNEFIKEFLINIALGCLMIILYIPSVIKRNKIKVQMPPENEPVFYNNENGETEPGLLNDQPLAEDSAEDSAGDLPEEQDESDAADNN